MRSAARIITASALIASSMVVGFSSTTHADCGGSGSIDDTGGTASGYCEGVSPGRPPSSSSARSRWEALCGSLLDWEEGARVTVTLVYSPLTEEVVRSAGFDLTGVYGEYNVNCTAGDEARNYYQYFVVTDPVDVTTLRDTAQARINPDPPSVETNPSFTDGFGVVRLPTWLWINDAWVALEEEESAGFVTVEVSATPISVNWIMGDGGSANCGGPGIPWSDATHSGGTYCSYTYTSSSADQDGATYSAEATQLWEFEWWINGDYQGVFGTLERDTPFSLAIGEIQAVEGDRD